MEKVTRPLESMLLGLFALSVVQLGAVDHGPSWGFLLAAVLAAGAAWRGPDARLPGNLAAASGLLLLVTTPFPAAIAPAALLLGLAMVPSADRWSRPADVVFALAGAIASMALVGPAGGADRLAAGALIGLEMMRTLRPPPRRILRWGAEGAAVTLAVIAVMSQPVAPRTLDSLADLELEPLVVAERWEPFRRTDVVTGPRGDKDLWTMVDGAGPVPAEAGIGPFETTRRHALLDVLHRAARGSGVERGYGLPPADDPAPAAPGFAVLASTHLVRGGQPVASVDAPRALSRAAFVNAWERLGPDGRLAWIAHDEAIFLRGLYVVAGLTEAEGRPLPSAGWAVRLREDADEGTPYRWMAIVCRGQPGRDTFRLLSSLEEAEVGRLLFGPGVATKDRFRVFDIAGGFERVPERAVFGFGRRLGIVVEPSVVPAGDGRFFRLSASMLRSEQGVALALTLLGLWIGLFSVSARRPSAVEEAGTAPPVPVRLGAAALPSAAVGYAAAVAVRGAVTQSGALFPDLAIALLAGALAAAVGRALPARRSLAWIGAGIGALAVAGLLLFPEPDPRVAGASLPALGVVVLGVLAAVWVGRGAAVDDDTRADDLRRGSARAAGTAFAIGVTLAELPGLAPDPFGVPLWIAALLFPAGAGLARWASSAQRNQRM